MRQTLKIRMTWLAAVGLAWRWVEAPLTTAPNLTSLTSLVTPSPEVKNEDSLIIDLL
jgi:hypothetical protein